MKDTEININIFYIRSQCIVKYVEIFIMKFKEAKMHNSADGYKYFI